MYVTGVPVIAASCLGVAIVCNRSQTDSETVPRFLPSDPCGHEEQVCKTASSTCETREACRQQAFRAFLCI